MYRRRRQFPSIFQDLLISIKSSEAIRPLQNHFLPHIFLISGALRENCATECDFLVPFMVINFLVVFVTFLLLIPMVIACLRSVRDSEHSLAIGLQVVFPCFDVKVCLVISLGSLPFPILQVCIARVIGSIPGPIAFGFFLDKTCVLWDQDCGKFPKKYLKVFNVNWNNLFCLGGDTACLAYDNWQMGVRGNQ